jgi:hypothetical protein
VVNIGEAQHSTDPRQQVHTLSDTFGTQRRSGVQWRSAAPIQGSKHTLCQNYWSDAIARCWIVRSYPQEHLVLLGRCCSC